VCLCVGLCQSMCVHVYLYKQLGSSEITPSFDKVCVCTCVSLSIVCVCTRVSLSIECLHTFHTYEAQQLSRASVRARAFSLYVHKYIACVRVSSYVVRVRVSFIAFVCSWAALSRSLSLSLSLTLSLSLHTHTCIHVCI
jgi:hypothetical protein